MLKIKDNVDLKELEKFGLKKDCIYKFQQGEIVKIPNYTISCESDYHGNEYLYVRIDNREIIMCIDDEVYRCDVCVKLLPVLFDLIQAGLVEKVVEE